MFRDQGNEEELAKKTKKLYLIGRKLDACGVKKIMPEEGETDWVPVG